MFLSSLCMVIQSFFFLAFPCSRPVLTSQEYTSIFHAIMFPNAHCRFQAVLTARGSESVFRIMEINDFKQLPHITLAFRPGNDSVVKQVCEGTGGGA